MQITKILAATSVVTFGALALANAQSTTTNSFTPTQNGLAPMHKTWSGKGNHRGHKGMGMRGNMQKINADIAAGNFSLFQTDASTTPIGKISQEVFNSLQAPTVAKQQAETSIKTILTNAGITMHGHGQADNEADGK